MPEIPEDKILNSAQSDAGRDFDLLDESQDESKSTVLVSKPGQTNPSRDLNPGMVFGKNYQILELIGKGGMSAVYKAYDRNLKRHVAVKVLAYKRKMDKKARARFVQEGIALSKLDHPNLIKIYEFGDADSAEPYLVMDFLKGTALSDIMAPKKALPAFRAVSIIKQCVDALRHAHNKGVVHRDLKPSNIMLIEDPDTKAEIVKIIDFGIAKVDEADSQRLTETGEVFGSPLYMSPEQCRGERLDERSDMYSLGCMFYELLTGRAPFVGVDFADTVGMHFNDTAKPLTEVRPDLKLAKELDAVVGKLMAKARKERYQTMGDVAEDLEPVYEELRAAHKESRARDDADKAVVADARAAAAAAQKESKNIMTARKQAEAKKASDEKKAQSASEGTAEKKPLAATLKEKTERGKMPLSKRKTMAACALLFLVLLTAKEIYDVYSGIKKHGWVKEEPQSIQLMTQTSKQLGWWQADMDPGEKLFDRGNYYSAYKHFNSALRTAQDLKDDNRNLIVSTTLEHLIDLCYVITNLNNGKFSDTEAFEDNSSEYKEQLAKLQPVPNREEMLAELEKFASAESPDAESSDHLSDEQKMAAVKIAAISTDLALSAPSESEALSLFEQANKHIKMLMRNKVPDFSELLVKQSQYLAGIGKSKEAAVLLAATAGAMRDETEILTRDRSQLKYAQGCLFWQMNDKKSAKECIEMSVKEAEQSGPETLQLLTSATLDFINQQQMESNRKINLLLPVLKNQLPRQYWLIAQSLRLSAEDHLINMQAVIQFEQGENKGMRDYVLSSGAQTNLKEFSDNGEAKLKRAIATLMRTRPYDKREILKSYQDLSDIYLCSKQFDELENLLPTVIAYGEQIPDFNPMERAAITHNLAYLKQRKKKFEEAEALYRKAISILGTIGSAGVSSPDLNREVLSDFNSLMAATGRSEEKLDVLPVSTQK